MENIIKRVDELHDALDDKRLTDEEARRLLRVATLRLIAERDAKVKMAQALHEVARDITAST